MSECMPHTIVIVADKGLPTALKEGLIRLGFHVEESREPICNTEFYNILPPNKELPPGCRGTNVIPHLNMIPDVLSLVNDWCKGVMSEHVFNASILRLRDVKQNYRPAWSVGGFKPPLRPPPMIVVAEVYFRHGLDETLKRVQEALSEGADAVSIGAWGLKGHLRDEYLETISKASKHTPVFADPGDKDLMVQALEAGASVGISITRKDLSSIPHMLREEKAFVLIPSSPEEDLYKTGLEAAQHGYSRIILDPVLKPLIYPGALSGLEEAHRLSKLWRGPIMLGINNVYELLDADTTGSIPTLIALAAEAGASIILVTEESWKARGAIIEARIAADLVSLSLYYKSPPKDYPLRLLIAKMKRPQPQLD